MKRFLNSVILVLGVCLLMISCDASSSDDNGDPPNTPEQGDPPNTPEQPSNVLQYCPQEKFSTYTLATEVEGELTTSDCTLSGTGTIQNDYIDAYNFTVSKQTTVKIQLRPSVNPARFNVYVIDSNKKEVAVFFIDNVGIVTTPLASGNYTLAIAGGVVKYSLSTSTDDQGFNGCPTLTKLELGTKIKGEFTGDDCEDGYVDYYEFSLLEPDSVAMCGSVSVALSLRDGTVLENNPIPRNGCLLRDLQAGSYVLSNYSRGLQQPFSYSLSISTTREGFLYCLDVKSLEFGITQQGKLDIADCEWPPYSFECGAICGGGVGKADHYSFELSERKEIQINYAFAGAYPYWQVYERRSGNKPRFEPMNPTSLTLDPGKYVLIVGYQYRPAEDPPFSPIEELEPYSLTVSIK
jgi:hypothetical protein